MSEVHPLPPAALRLRRGVLVFGLVLLAICGLGWILSAEAFFRSYLFAWVFYLGVSLGSMAWVMIYHLTGGGWGRAIQRIAEAAALNLPLLLLLFVPIICGLRWLYPWAHADQVAHDAILRHKSTYLNITWWTIRALVYFAIWIALAWALAHRSSLYDQTRSEAVARRLRQLSAIGLPIMILTISLAAVDWILSREPHYYSTIFGFIVIVGVALSAILFLVITLTALLRQEPLRSFVTAGHYHDLGNLIFTCVILWAYVSFAQFLITWMGQIQVEVKWYYLRSKGVYGFVAILLIALHFFTPFVLLLFRPVKRRPQILCRLAVGLLIVRLFDWYWMVVPTGEPVRSLNRLWLNIAAPLGIGGVWLAAFLWNLGRRPLLAVAIDAHASRAATNPDDSEPGSYAEPNAHLA